MRIYDLPTPAALVDLDILQRNIQSMADAARRAGVRLRPHVKTHKMHAIARMQLEAGAVGLTCAKVSEAEVMAASGARDILIAYPVVGDWQIERIVRLARRVQVTVAFDSEFAARKLNEAARDAGLVLPLYLIVDTGNRRDGVLPGEPALQLAKKVAALPHVRLAGIMTHEGHVGRARDEEELKAAVAAAARDMVATAALLRESGIEVEQVSVGSTPACKSGIVIDGITEWRPGTYVFNDVNELSRGTPLENCALSILATVVSHSAIDRAVIDAGSKTLTSEPARRGGAGFGYIKEWPKAVLERLYEEHGVVQLNGEACEIGQRVTIIPNHVCPVVNLMEHVYVTRGDEVIDQWPVDARGKIQ
ncbi:alanine racemase [Alicyclobacillus macrosporangiidus]|uniref:D-serine deaminase, pyridoxal phosphate-dependent n=1 Tax=Alicyclobacillus macrosporangiidus TaxID=392015 RepID=A0A1I7G6C3_9BACL|nr:alanine racemase [Alicyclobacillus macrosporangiidus]SFU44012.1 D-serine deaminase, pyridoxal phosphate-dependent [Alicyclobacillus macrosporangiidus]